MFIQNLGQIDFWVLNGCVFPCILLGDTDGTPGVGIYIYIYVLV